MDIQWWHWIVAGLLLIATELAVPAMVLVWFGLAAVVMGVLVALMPSLSLTTQILVWTVLSVALVVLWMRVFKPGVLKTRAGTPDAMIGETGLLVSDVAPFRHGEVRFQRPVMGSDVWDCVADDNLKAGSRVVVTAIEGSTVRVALRG